MPIGDLKSRVSIADREKAKTLRNPPEFEPGFEGKGSADPDDYGEMFTDNLFDDSDMGDLGGDLSSNLQGNPSMGGGLGGGLGGSIGGGLGGLGGGLGGLGGIGGLGGGLGGFGTPMKQEAPKKDTLDKAIDFSEESFASMGRIIADLFKSIKTRTADDWGVYSKNMIVASGALTLLAVLISIIGAASGVSALKFTQIPLTIILASVLSLGTGLIIMAGAAFRIASGANRASSTVSDIPDIEQEESLFDDDESDVEDELQSLMGELFGGEDEKEEIIEQKAAEKVAEQIGTDFSSKLSTIREKVPLLTREILFNTFKPFFMNCTADYATSTVVDEDSEQFELISTACLKAIAAAGKMELEAVKSRVEVVKENLFSYEILITRDKKLNKMDDIAREMEAYFRDGSKDLSVSATVETEGDYYRVIITKGAPPTVTLGDVLTDPKVCEYFLDTSNLLPSVAGITELGEPILLDHKNYDALMIAGRQRSGKSWAILTILLSMMAFNTPEEVAFLLIDPKESQLFKTLALMPHVCGRHNDSNILQIMRDVIEMEGARRKKLLADNRCDTIWELRRRKNILIPVLYIMVDEFITVKGNLGPNAGELDALMTTIMSQFPSLGIRMMIVPHRAQGVVDKTIRDSLISYKAAFRCEADIVKETLGVTRWDKSLVLPGDCALKVQDMGKEMYVRGLGVTTADELNSELILNIAKAYYKMGVEIPEMKSIGKGYNRNEDFIKHELEIGSGSSRVQFDIDLESDDSEEIDF